MPEPQNLVVLLVEDDLDLQSNLIMVLQLTGYTVRAYAKAECLLADLSNHAQHKHATCVLMDVNLEGMNGIEAQRKLRHLVNNMPVVFMSGQISAHNVNEAWRGGAHNFLFKPFNSQELFEALKKAFASDTRTTDDPVDEIDEHQSTEPITLLTPKQKEVLEMVVSGLSNTAISSRMSISARTVKMHRAGLMQKLGFKHVAELVRFYERYQKTMKN